MSMDTKLPSGLLPIPSRVTAQKPFRLLRYFTTASLAVIILVYLASGFAGGWLIYGAFLENEKEESENISDAFADLANASGFPPEMWGKSPLPVRLKSKLLLEMEDFDVVQFTFYDLNGHILENLMLHGAENRFNPQALNPESLQIAKSGGKTIGWYSKVWTPLLPFVHSQGVTETYSAIRDNSNQVIAVARVNRDMAPVLEQVRFTLLNWMTEVGLVCLAVFAILWLLVRKADRVIKAQHQDLKDLSNRKDEFLAICSHDVRSPLAGVLAGTKVLLSERKAPLTEFQREVLVENEKSVRLILDLVNTLLDMARLEAGAESLHVETVEVNQAVRDSCMLLRGLLEAHHVILELQLAAQDVTLQGDRLKILRMITNVVSNAIKHAQGKPVTVRVIPKSDGVCVSVIDRGNGIRQEDLHCLFDKFTTLAHKKKSRDEGTGLGLSIVQKLITLHGGSVQVESELGKGSVFNLNFPLQPPAQTA